MTHRQLADVQHQVAVAIELLVNGDDQDARRTLEKASRSLVAARHDEDPPEVRSAAKRLLHVLSALHASEATP